MPVPLRFPVHKISVLPATHVSNSLKYGVYVLMFLGLCPNIFSCSSCLMVVVLCPSYSLFLWAFLTAVRPSPHYYLIMGRWHPPKLRIMCQWHRLRLLMMLLWFPLKSREVSPPLFCTNSPVCTIPALFVKMVYFGIFTLKKIFLGGD